MSTAIILSQEVLLALSESARAEIAAIVFGGKPAEVEAALLDFEAADHGVADLSPAQAKTFLDRCSAKSVAVLRAVVKAPTDGFYLSEVIKEMGETDATALTGVWGGLTKRVRTVLGDKSAYLFYWTRIEDGDWHGRLTPMTYSSFNKALGL